MLTPAGIWYNRSCELHFQTQEVLWVTSIKIQAIWRITVNLLSIYKQTFSAISTKFLLISPKIFDRKSLWRPSEKAIWVHFWLVSIYCSTYRRNNCHKKKDFAWIIMTFFNVVRYICSSQKNILIHWKIHVFKEY